MPRSFAIIPAAGDSTRMGAPKLLLPVGSQRLIEPTLAAWKCGGVDKIIVVVRPGDEELALLCRSFGAEVVIPPTPPPQMKDSVQYGLKYVESIFSPASEDVWLLAPADMPNLSPRIVQMLLSSHDPLHPAILTPTLSGRRGHPVLFPWPLAAQTHELRQNEGINALRQSHESREVPCDTLEAAGTAPFADIDTPEDYGKLT